MGFIFRLIKRLITSAVLFIIFAAVIAFLPNLPPYATFSSIKHEPSQPRVGPLAPNSDLNNAEKLYKGKLLGPEAFEFYNGDVYTSLATGEVVKLSPGGHVTFVTKIGQPCKGHTQQHICGRPLGIKINEKKQELYVADAYYGIWKVNLNTDKKQLLVSPHISYGDRYPKLFNDLALAKNGDIYWTESSSDFPLHDGVYSTFVDPSGRLFHYNAAKNESKVLLEKLWFPNGIAISPDNQFVVISETLRYRVMKYYIDGPKKGTSEVFISGLPGSPDNLRALPDGSGILVALYASFDDDQPMISKSMSETPLVRKFIARLARLIELPFELLNTYYPNIFCEEIVHSIGHFGSASAIMPTTTGLVQIDWNGKVIASYYNTDGSARSISDAIVYNNKLYMGTPNKQDFVAAVPAPPLLKKAFAPIKSTPPLKTAEKVTEDVPKPKTETKPVEKPQEIPKEKIKVAKPVETTKPTPPKDVKVDPKAAQPPPKQADRKPETTTPPPKQEAPKTSPPRKEPNTQTEQPPTTKPIQTPPSHKPTQPPPTPKPTQPPPVAKPAPPPPSAKPAEPSSAKPAPPPSPKPTQPPPTGKSAEAAPSVKPTQPPPSAKPTQPSPAKPAKPAPSAKPTSPPPEVKKTPENKDTKEQIPIKEEIPSDTVKPSKETLKVIKKNGPTEIPNPSL